MSVMVQGTEAVAMVVVVMEEVAMVVEASKFFTAAYFWRKM
jgi:hypothetical protein